MIWHTAIFVCVHLSKRSRMYLFHPVFLTGRMQLLPSKSACHHMTVDVMITIPATTRDIGEQLS